VRIKQQLRQPWLPWLVIGLVLRIAYLTLFRQRAPISDDLFYWSTAQSLAAGHGYVSNGVPATGWMPGLSLLLASWTWLFGARLWVMRLGLVLLSAASLPVTWRVSERWFGVRVARWSTGTMAVYPTMWFYSTALLSETPAVLCVLIALDLSGQLRERFSWSRAVGLGLTYAALFYLKPEFVFLGPLYAAVALFRRDLFPRRAAVTVCAIGAVLLAPWSWRNWRLFHEFIPLKSSGGLTLWCASWHPPIMELSDPRLEDAQRRLGVPGKPGETSRRFSREAKERLLAAPGRYLLDCLVVRMRLLFFGPPTEASVELSRSVSDLRTSGAWPSLALKVLLFLVQSAICLLGLIGAVVLPDAEGRRTVPRLHLAVNTAIYLTVIAVTRYSLVLMPILIPHGVALIARRFGALGDDLRDRRGGLPGLWVESRIAE
jgi:4-amino-4-deoxy-L-arabinose transferase-like glycosyltransferase